MSEPSLTRFRRCSKCGCTKPATTTFFTVHRYGKDGLNARCKTCNRLAYGIWSRANKEHKRLYDQQRRRDNREQLDAAYRVWFERNREYRNAYNREYVKNNPAVRRKKQMYEAERERGIKWTAEAKQYALLIAGDPCVYCGGPAETVDHIVPVKHGGDSDWENMAPACRSCNSSKGARSLLEFLLVGAPIAGARMLR